jgi:phage shock protein B
MTVFLFVPIIVCLVVVAPTWIIFHYITKWKVMKQQELGDGMVAVNKEELMKLRAVASKLEQRIVTLERILDQD